MLSTVDFILYKFFQRQRGDNKSRYRDRRKKLSGLLFHTRIEQQLKKVTKKFMLLLISEFIYLQKFHYFPDDFCI